MPYNPQTQYRGDLYLSRGLSEGLGAISDAIESRNKEKKDRARKFKGLQEYADAAGIIAKDESTTMSLDELEGRVRAEEYKRLKSESDLRQQSMQVQLGAAQEQVGTAQRMRQFSHGLAEYAGTPSVAGTLGNAMASPESGVTLSELNQYMGANPVNNQVTPEAIMGMAGRSGVLTPAMAAELAAMSQPKRLNEFPVSALGQPTGAPVGGFQFVPTSTGGGQLVPLEPSAGAGAPLPAVPGYTPVPTGRGGVQWLQEPKAVQDARAKAAARLKTLRAQEATLSAKVADGNNSVGPEFLGLGDRSAKLSGVKSEIEAIQTQFPDLAPPSAQGTAGTGSPPKFGNFNEGDLVRGKDGRLYRIVNGRPVPQ